MLSSKTLSAGSKPHFMLLDGLRGVAALMVMCYHIFEAFATSPFDQGFNHGYLAVDFFFVLSGFVVGYAYDDRRDTMSACQFLRRRLIRLHPMIVIGAVFGLIAYILQGCVKWDGSAVSVSSILLSFFCALLLIPAAPGASYDVRGNTEMYPLNGPSWSLFFEYIGNIFYAIFLRRLSTPLLAVVVALSGVGLAWAALGNLSGFGHIGMGWSLADGNFLGGLLRMTFAFSAGLLMTRVFRPVRVRSPFLLCSLALVAILSVPYVGGPDRMWMNGLYDIFCVACVFPFLVWIGASGAVGEATRPSFVCRFLGDISYPVYAIHYPLMYLFYAWVWNNGYSFADVWPMALAVIAGSVVLAWLSMRFYDMPVRRWLNRRFGAQ